MLPQAVQLHLLCPVTIELSLPRTDNQPPALQEDDDEVGLFSLPNSRNRFEHWHTFLLDDSAAML